MLSSCKAPLILPAVRLTPSTPPVASAAPTSISRAASRSSRTVRTRTGPRRPVSATSRSSSHMWSRPTAVVMDSPRAMAGTATGRGTAAMGIPITRRWARRAHNTRTMAATYWAFRTVPPMVVQTRRRSRRRGRATSAGVRRCVCRSRWCGRLCAAGWLIATIQTAVSWFFANGLDQMRRRKRQDRRPMRQLPAHQRRVFVHQACAEAWSQPWVSSRKSPLKQRRRPWT